MEKETLLVKYFEGSLSLEEQVHFEQFLNEDADFKSQYELEKDVQMVIRDSERDTLKQKLLHFESERNEEVVEKTNFWKPMRIAASLLILVGASWFIYNSGMFNNSQDLYAANYEKYPNTVYTITRGDGNDNSIERKAFEAYESEKYELAIGHFIALKAETGLDYVDFYLAQSYVANGQEQKAIETFKEISDVNSDFSAESLWYEGLIQLKLEKNKEAEILFEALLKDGSYKKQEARELLEALK